MSAVMMLRHLSEYPAADRIEAALNKVLEGRELTTRDIGGKASTTEFGEAIIAALST
jgi:isocitrate dehydrogenase (NAD+)